jgi:hypothetical protein
LATRRLRSLFKDGAFDAEAAQAIIGQVAEGSFDPTELKSWLFEEQIATPGSHHTSFRVVADAFGRVHYAQVARAAASKESPADPSVTRDTPLPRREVDMWGADTSIFLTHPDSPFYIAPKQVTSNISTGGIRIRLNGQPAEGQEDRAALQELGIDPDSPLLSAALHDASGKIGKLSRSEYPFVGVDYLRDARTGENVLLEVNTGPQLDPEALGLPSGTDEVECDLKMLERVLSTAPESRAA